MSYRIFSIVGALAVTCCAFPLAPNHTFGAVNTDAPRVVLINGGVSSISARVTAAIAASLEYPLYEYILQNDSRVDAVVEGIEAVKPRVIIALGERGLQLAHNRFPTVPLIYALVVQDDSRPLAGANIMGIGLNLSPKTEFLMYKLVLKNLKEVVAFYTPGRSDALLHKAQVDLKALGVNLALVNSQTMDAPDKAGAAVSHADALWWFNDPGMMSQSGFTHLLKLANDSHKPVLSSSFRELAVAGSLMAFTLDLGNVGGQAASLATGILQAGSVTMAGVYEPIGGHLVFNSVVARHLGVNLPAGAQPFVSEVLGKVD